jgi:hypothetical protein
MAAPVYSVNDGTHTIDFPDGTRLELHRPQRDRNGRLIADSACLTMRADGSLAAMR